jgi:hypothetical protein
MQRDVLVRQPAFRAGQLSDSLGEAFLALESAMQDPAARLELFCLRKGTCAACALDLYTPRDDL